ncbi:MAG: AmmeMemoRadiSam system radical SAM enzyme [Treponema sp.]|jgi:pyruvate formate lyase activating enzyme|nr:AmmeMemoRadiSam system radical SAM enzyme [Treponema sp.]
MAADNRPRYFSAVETKDGLVRCGLCPHRCGIPPGGSGRCGVRQNRSGAGAIPFYGLVTAMAADPIEKKPLYHFRPGSSILSIGFAGCNLICPFCQNWRISQGTTAAAEGREFSPAEIIAAARTGGFRQIAYTYSEPLVHAEFLLDCMKLAREEGIANILVSNGCVNREPAADILALTDAANIDLKAFSEETYSRILGGNLPAVLAFIEAAWAAGVHLEITTLMAPGLNDGDEETGKCAAFITGLSRDIPWHLSACHPAYRWRTPATDSGSLIRAVRRARETLPYVYAGNIDGGTQAGELHDTACPACGGLLVRRRAYRIDTSGLALKKTESGCGYYCAHCGAEAPIVS